jgi:hypothetical protein
MNDCDHDRIESEWTDADQYGLRIPVGTCLDCGASMTLTGEEDDEGHPTWEPDYTAEELLVIYNQSGGSVRRA